MPTLALKSDITVGLCSRILHASAMVPSTYEYDDIIRAVWSELCPVPFVEFEGLKILSKRDRAILW
jgi:hypothetical protein